MRNPININALNDLKKRLNELDSERHLIEKQIKAIENSCEHKTNDQVLVWMWENLYKCEKCGAEVRMGRDWT